MRRFGVRIPTRSQVKPFAIQRVLFLKNGEVAQLVRASDSYPLASGQELQVL